MCRPYHKIRHVLIGLSIRYMSLTLKRLLLVALILAFIVATVVNVASSFISLPLLLVNIFLALISILQAVQWFTEFGPERRARQVEKIAAVSSPEDLERKYLINRRAAFAAEQKLFINTALTTEIQPQYRAGGAQSLQPGHADRGLQGNRRAADQPQ